MTKAERARRDREIYEMREAGASLDAIAWRADLSRSRIQQIHKREAARRADPQSAHDTDRLTPKQARRARRDQDIYEMREVGMTFEAIATRMRLSYDRTRQIYHREDARRSRVTEIPRTNDRDPRS